MDWGVLGQPLGFSSGLGEEFFEPSINLCSYSLSVVFWMSTFRVDLVIREFKIPIRTELAGVAHIAAQVSR